MPNAFQGLETSEFPDRRSDEYVGPHTKDAPTSIFPQGFRLPSLEVPIESCESHSFSVRKLVHQAFQHEHAMPASDHLGVQSQHIDAARAIGVCVREITFPRLLNGGGGTQSHVVQAGATPRDILEGRKIIEAPEHRHLD